MPSVAAMPASEENVTGVLYDAQRLFDLGCTALLNDSFDEAADCLSKALEIRVLHYGELAPECATTYYKYGCALFDKLQAEADPLCEPVAAKGNNGASSPSAEPSKAKEQTEDPADEEDGEGDGEVDDGEDREEEEEGDLEDAWKMLEFARVIHEKHGFQTIETVDIVTKLADVNCFKEDYKTCFDDYAKALQLLECLVEPDSRNLAELHFKIALAHQLDLKPKEALDYCNRAVSICEARVQRLRNELVQAKGEGAHVKLLGVIGHEKGEEVKVLEEESKGKGLQEKLESLSAADAAMLDNANLEDPEEEIKEIEESLMDLREKADELKEMASAPSLVEALQAANPEAVANIKQIVSLVAGSQASGSSNGAFDAPSTSEGFDAPSLGGASSSTANVTHLGVVGRGVKRATSMAVSNIEASTAPEGQPRKRSLDDMMMGGGFDETQIGFGEKPDAMVNGDGVHNESTLLVPSGVQVDGTASKGVSSNHNPQ